MRSSEAERKARNSRHAAILIPFTLMLDMSYRIAASVALTLKETKDSRVLNSLGAIYRAQRDVLQDG